MMIYNIYYERYLFLLLLWKELIFIHTTGCMLLFYKKGILLLLFVQLRKSLGKSWNIVENLRKVVELWCKKPGKSEKKVLESPGIWIWKYGFCLSQKIVISCDVSCNLFSYQEHPSWMLLLSLLRGYVFNKGLFN